jgi:hypothetical protein
MLKEKRNDYQQMKLTIQPQLVIVGTLLNPQEILVSIDNVIYKAESIVKAIDMTFKIYMALNLKYQITVEGVWLYIQKYLYDINLKHDPLYTAVTEFHTAITGQ